MHFPGATGLMSYCPDEQTENSFTKTNFQEDDEESNKGFNKEESFEMLNSPLTLLEVATFFLMSGFQTHILSLTTDSNVVIPTLRESQSLSLS